MCTGASSGRDYRRSRAADYGNRSKGEIVGWGEELAAGWMESSERPEVDESGGNQWRGVATLVGEDGAHDGGVASRHRSGGVVDEDELVGPPGRPPARRRLL